MVGMRCFGLLARCEALRVSPDGRHTYNTLRLSDSPFLQVILRKEYQLSD